MSERVFVLGAGRAGRGLARALRASGVDVVGLHGRRAAAGADAVTAGPLAASSVAEATVVLVAVRDAQLDEALDELGRARLAPGAVVLHASGSGDPAALERVRAAGHPAGTFHPLVPLADPRTAPALLRGAWIGVDGDGRAHEAARALATNLGAHVLSIPAGEKPRYHAAAVFASNFPAVLAALASRLMHEAGVPQGDAWSAVRRLMGAAVENLEGQSPAAALTGPVVRGDVETIRRHVRALRADAGAMAAYAALTRAAVELARESGAAPAALAEISALVDPGPGE